MCEQVLSLRHSPLLSGNHPEIQGALVSTPKIVKAVSSKAPFFLGSGAEIHCKEEQKWKHLWPSPKKRPQALSVTAATWKDWANLRPVLRVCISPLRTIPSLTSPRRDLSVLGKQSPAARKAGKLNSLCGMKFGLKERACSCS